MRKIKTITKLAIFFILFILIFIKVSSILAIAQDATPTVKAYQSFYKEPEDQLQIVTLGNSRMNFGWSSVGMWKKTGYTSYNMATFSQPAVCIRYLLEEIRKTQKNPLFIIDISAFRNDQIYGMNQETIRRVTDVLPLSETKIHMINAALEVLPAALNHQIEQNKEDVEKVEQLKASKKNISKFSFYLPFVKYHGRWNDLTEEDFLKTADMYKSTLCTKSVLKVEPQEETKVTRKAGTLDSLQKKLVSELLNYIEQEELNVLFVSMPAYVTEANQTQLNAIIKELEKKDYPCLNFNTKEMYQQLGLDFAVDFRDNDHVNETGSEKVMQYMAQYLTDHYTLTDMRGVEGYESWEEAVENYATQIAAFKQEALEEESSQDEIDESTTQEENEE